MIQQVQKKKTDCLLNNGEVLSRATQLAERAAFISQVAWMSHHLLLKWVMSCHKAASTTCKENDFPAAQSALLNVFRHDGGAQNCKRHMGTKVFQKSGGRGVDECTEDVGADLCSVHKWLLVQFITSNQEGQILTMRTSIIINWCKKIIWWAWAQRRATASWRTSPVRGAVSCDVNSSERVDISYIRRHLKNLSAVATRQRRREIFSCRVVSWTADTQTLTGSDHAADSLRHVGLYEDWQFAANVAHLLTSERNSLLALVLLRKLLWTNW